jgi:glycosyltransferase involved in cell wall biosynthesis
VLAWVREGGRPRELAAALGGEPKSFFDLGIVRRSLVPLRYLVSSLRTIAYLFRRRPRALIVQAPPVVLAVLADLYGRLTKAPVVIDSHPAAFGIEGSSVDRALLPLLARLARRASGCIVTTDELGDRVREWGGRPLVVHEAPPGWLMDDEALTPDPNTVLFVSTFAPDEPLEELLEAARTLPDIRFRITGDLRRLRPELRRRAPENVEWLGYLTGAQYPQALRRAAVVVTLTDRRESVPRSAYEAVYARRPLVSTAWPHMHDLFPQATLVENKADAIAAGIRQVFDSEKQHDGSTERAYELQQARWRAQVQHLRAAVGFQRDGVGNDRRGAVLVASESNGGTSL